MHSSIVKSAKGPVPLHAVKAADFRRWMNSRPKREQDWLKAAHFSAKDGELILIPGMKGLAGAVLGLGKGTDKYALAQFSEQLPPGAYAFADIADGYGGANGTLAWILGTYVFGRYRKSSKREAKLVAPKGVDAEEASRIAEGIFLARDLINTPSNDMGPDELTEAARDLAKTHGAKISVVVGNDLLKKNFPLIHAVGRASVRAPRLIDMTWGKANAPKVTLVGKGVVFDTGGLDIKPSSGMLMMKKDMGGSATVLALAHMIMGAKLNLRLRVLIPAVENSVSGNAYRPGDVFPSRKGLTVEIGNTDAEGRLVLADALAEADAENPELLIDIATLTGAARAATGFELPPYFTDDEELSKDLMHHANNVQDFVWRLPLWRGYESSVNSAIADINNSPSYGFAGAITAALFLNRFVTNAKSWMHLDIPAWVDRPKPGRRAGAEANTARALYALIASRYPVKG
ncbi:MAG: leucyl aminopeptidase family protein [Proteobacteria bacterium]|nr:leucyl aminopeptidase family protein [Pseudomonadota bacterium]